jgi:hypothetical protein
MNAKGFDQKFDDGEEDIIDMLDLSKAKRPFAEQKNVSVSLPIWMIELIDKEANRLGVTPQAVIQISLAQHLGFYESFKRGIGLKKPMLHNQHLQARAIATFSLQT